MSRDQGFTSTDELPENRQQTDVPLDSPRYPIFVVTAWVDARKSYPWRRFELQTYQEARSIFEREVSVLASWQSIEIAELSGPGQPSLILQEFLPQARCAR